MTSPKDSEPQPLLKSGDPSQSLTVSNTQSIATLEPFDQPVILRQPRFWSRAIAWSLMGVTSIVVIWASVAQIDEAVPAQGKLEPEGTVTEVQAPVGGVIKEVLVKDGQKVKKGEVLVRLDSAAVKAQLGSLAKVKTALTQETNFYRSVLQGLPTPDTADLPPERLSLTRNREGLEAENRLYNAQLSGTGGDGLAYDQQLRLQAIRSESSSRINAKTARTGSISTDHGTGTVTRRPKNPARPRTAFSRRGDSKSPSYSPKTTGIYPPTGRSKI
jgi:hemolysin D